MSNFSRIMPQKDLTSSNENTFSMRRSMFSRIINTEVKEVNDVLQKKQYYGGTRNRDASSVICKRAIIGTKNSFANENGVSFQATKEYNATDKALRRTRAGGTVVPPKVTNKHLM
jgi:hypothetical protein